MNVFGELLRKYRNQCDDPINPGRRLSQERLGQLLGAELGGGYSGAAVSDWERGESKIHADHRLLLVGLIKVLFERGGLKTLDDANLLLEAGNYRGLDAEEQRRAFGDSDSNEPTTKSEVKPPTSHFFLANSLFDSPQEFQDWLAAAEDGPPPVWPRIVTASLRRVSDRLSAAKGLRGLLWVWIWVIGYALIAPSSRWPFPNPATARVFILWYVCASLILPLCVGVLVNTDKNPFWQQQPTISRIVHRLYTYQGAFIGFHLGYFAVLAVNLLLYFLDARFLPWLEFVLLGIPLVMSYVAAQVVPHNLWRAYGRLHLADGAIFFVFLILGPLWGWFFAEFYPVLLTPLSGIVVILSALTLLAGTMAWQFHRTQSRANGSEGNISRQ